MGRGLRVVGAIGGVILCAIAPPPCQAADLIEPWASGVSDLEGYVGGTTLGIVDSGSFVVGGGAHGLSVGVSLEADDDAPTRLGVFIARTWEAARLGSLDLWAASGLPVSPREGEIGRADLTTGFEWSRPVGSVVPYARPSLSIDGGRRTWHPLLGLLVPMGRRLGVHVEVSGVRPAASRWPSHVAVSPNWLLADGIELIPEVAVTQESGTTELAFSFGVVIDPRGTSHGDASGRTDP